MGNENALSTYAVSSGALGVSSGGVDVLELGLFFLSHFDALLVKELKQPFLPVEFLSVADGS